MSGAHRFAFALFFISQGVTSARSKRHALRGMAMSYAFERNCKEAATYENQAGRWEHAQARIAARWGNQAEAGKHVDAAKAILDKATTNATEYYRKSSTSNAHNPPNAYAHPLARQ